MDHPYPKLFEYGFNLHLQPSILQNTMKIALLSTLIALMALLSVSKVIATPVAKPNADPEALNCGCLGCDGKGLC